MFVCVYVRTSVCVYVYMWGCVGGRACTLVCEWHDILKGGPEPLEQEIHEILGSKREDRFS